jgi:transposase
MKPYSAEFRREVLAACDAGEQTKAVAEKFGVSPAWVRRIKQERRELSKTAPLLTRRRIPTWMKEAEQIQAMIIKSPDLTLDELKLKLNTKLSRSTLCRALQKLRLTIKKKS